MFDIGWQELFILAVLAIIVIGPKDLPQAIRTITKGIRKARSMARDLQDGMDDVIREAELEDIKETIAGDGMDVAKRIEEAVDLDMDDMDLDGDLRKDMMGAVDDLKSITKPGEAEKTDPPAEEAAPGDVKEAAPGVKTKKAKTKKAKTKKAKTKGAPKEAKTKAASKASG